MTSKVTGDKRLDSQLRLLGDRVSRKVARSGLSAGLVVAKRAIQREAPRGKYKRGKKPSGPRIRQAIGQRLVRDRKSKIYEAKAGVNVGKKGKRRAPHGHLATLGTHRRTNKAGANRGRMSANRFVSRAYQSSKSAALIAMRGRIVTRIKAEEAKL